MQILVILYPGFEEIEAITPIDLLRRASIEVKVASTSNELLVRGQSKIEVKAEFLLDDALEEKDNFDCVLIPGGAGAKALCEDNRVVSLIRSRVKSNRWVASICAAPLVLERAGVLEGHRYTAHPSTLQELPNAIQDGAVVVSKPLITSQGPGTSIEFSLKVIEIFCGIQQRQAVAKAICYPA